MSSAYGNIQPPLSTTSLPLPFSTSLNDASTVIITAVDASDSLLLERLRQLLNAEILAGNTYPQEQPLDKNGFAAYFLSANAFVARNSANEVLGTFYMKPNFPGRCSHICNGGFIVAENFRQRGVGKAMAKAFLFLAPKLGYRASMFNLFENNIGSIALWRSLGFQEIGRIPKAGRLRITSKGEEVFSDAIMFYYNFSILST